MLKIIKGGFFGGGRDRMKAMIGARVAEKKHSYLIVPEQQTVMTELEMSRELDSTAPLYFEVTNFTRLANTTFRALGGVCGEYCTKSKKMLIMWRTLTELSPILTMTQGRREISAGLVERAMSAITDMQLVGIDASELSTWVDHDDVRADKRLFDKINDLSKIYSLYNTLLHERYSDTADDIAVMSDKLAKNREFLSDSEIFIEGFTSFTETQYRLLSLLLERTDLTVYLTVPKSSEGAFEYTELHLTEDKLKNISRLANADIKLFVEDTNRSQKSEAISEIGALLFRNLPKYDKISLQNKDEIRIFECQTPYDMCEFLAADIKRRVIGGARFSDFAIVARDGGQYRGLIDTALSRSGVTFYMSEKSDVSSFEAIKLIYTAYAAIRRGFLREDVMTYAKCGLSGISREACDELECYVDTWQIGGSRFTDELDWNMNPRGYNASHASDESERLIRINKTRRELLLPLCRFADSLSSAHTVKDHAHALLDFLLDIDLEGALARRAALLTGLGETRYAEENSRLWKLICDSLDAIVEVSADMPADADSFAGQLKVLFSFAEIGSIPEAIDSVTVGSADMLRLYGKSHVYLIGVNAGEFPAAATDSSYFSERDKILLGSLGLAIKPEMEIRSSKELYFFSRAFNYASESVTLLYCARDNNFKSILPADVIGKISRLSGGEVSAVRAASLGVSERIWSAEAALEYSLDMTPEERSAMKAALIRAGHARTVEISERSIENSDLSLGREICEREREKNMNLSQSRLDTFMRCPLSYFCKYTVKLSEQSRAEFDAASIGSFIHSILENFFRAVRDAGLSAADMSADEKRELVERAAKSYVSQLSSEISLGPAHVRVKIERLSRAAMPIVNSLCEEFARSKFVPTYFEMSLTSQDSAAPGAIKISREGEGDINIRGIVDRVDTYKKDDDVYVRVVDYKTGTKDFSPDDMSEGRNLQMFLYLDAIVKSKNRAFIDSIGATDGRLIPAGVIYHKSSLSDIRVATPDDALAERAVMDAQEREGMIIDDPEIIGAMGLEFTPVYSKRYPDKITDSKREFMFSEQGWEDIMSTVYSSVNSITDGIRSGNATACPSIIKNGSTPCEYCEFSPVCRKAVIDKQ